jgi:hypothetical protein
VKPNSVIIFLGTGYELCMAFGLFGKENLEYKSEFDHRVYKNSKYVKYYFEKLNCDIIFLSQPKHKALLSAEISFYKDDFYKYIADFKFYWPHHYVLDTKKYNEIKSVDLNVYLSLIAMDSYMSINTEPETQYWNN